MSEPDARGVQNCDDACAMKLTCFNLLRGALAACVFSAFVAASLLAQETAAPSPSPRAPELKIEALHRNIRNTTSGVAQHAGFLFLNTNDPCTARVFVFDKASGNETSFRDTYVRDGGSSMIPVRKGESYTLNVENIGNGGGASLFLIHVGAP